MQSGATAGSSTTKKDEGTLPETAVESNNSAGQTRAEMEVLKMTGGLSETKDGAVKERQKQKAQTKPIQTRPTQGRTRDIVEPRSSDTTIDSESQNRASLEMLKMTGVLQQDGGTSNRTTNQQDVSEDIQKSKTNHPADEEATAQEKVDGTPPVEKSTDKDGFRQQSNKLGDSLPGAHPHQPSKNTIGNDDEDDDIVDHDHGSSIPAGENDPTIHPQDEMAAPVSNDFLVEATLVEEGKGTAGTQQDNLFDPVPIVMAEEPKLTDFLQNRRLQCFLAGLIVIVVIIFGVSFGLLAKSKDGDPVEEEPQEVDPEIIYLPSPEDNEEEEEDGMLALLTDNDTDDQFNNTDNEPLLFIDVDSLLPSGEYMLDQETPLFLLPLSPNASNFTATISIPEFTIPQLNNTESPQFRALDWLSRHPNLPTLEEWRKQQLFAMVSMYYALNGDGWPNGRKRNYLSYDHEECDWGTETSRGDICRDNGRIKTLALKRYNSPKPAMHGTVPPEVALLSNLQWFDMSGLEYEGNITDILPPPVALKNLPDLTDIWVIDNEETLTGKVPMEELLLLQDSLASFRVTNNNLTGTLPTELGLLSYLELLRVSRNRFTGTIPKELFQIPALEKIFSVENLLTGSIPAEIGLAVRLQAIHFQGNQLSGTIPSELGLASQIKTIKLHENDITGTVPEEVCVLPSLNKIEVDCDQVLCECLKVCVCALNSTRN